MTVILPTNLKIWMSSAWTLASSGSFSPPYCRTGVNEVENTWQWDVPAATALLMGCESSVAAREPHYETAMFDIENSRQEIVGADGKSRKMLYYNRDFAELAPIYV